MTQNTHNNVNTNNRVLLHTRNTRNGHNINTSSGRNSASTFSPQTLPNADNFQNSFANKLSGEFAAKRQYNIPPNRKCVATLPCEILMSEKTATT